MVETPYATPASPLLPLQTLSAAYDTMVPIIGDAYAFAVSLLLPAVKLPIAFWRSLAFYRILTLGNWNPPLINGDTTYTDQDTTDTDQDTTDTDHDTPNTDHDTPNTDQDTTDADQDTTDADQQPTVHHLAIRHIAPISLVDRCPVPWLVSSDATLYKFNYVIAEVAVAEVAVTEVAVTEVAVAEVAVAVAVEVGAEVWGGVGVDEYLPMGFTDLGMDFGPWTLILLGFLGLCALHSVWYERRTVRNSSTMFYFDHGEVEWLPLNPLFPLKFDTSVVHDIDLPPLEPDFQLPADPTNSSLGPREPATQPISVVIPVSDETTFITGSPTKQQLQPVIPRNSIRPDYNDSTNISRRSGDSPQKHRDLGIVTEDLFAPIVGQDWTTISRANLAYDPSASLGRCPSRALSSADDDTVPNVLPSTQPVASGSSRSYSVHEVPRQAVPLDDEAGPVSLVEEFESVQRLTRTVAYNSSTSLESLSSVDDDIAPIVLSSMQPVASGSSYDYSVHEVPHHPVSSQCKADALVLFEQIKFYQKLLGDVFSTVAMVQQPSGSEPSSDDERIASIVPSTLPDVADDSVYGQSTQDRQPSGWLA